MKVLGCTGARRLLEALHDMELAVADQIAVTSHLEGCQACGAAYAELEFMRAALRTVAPGRTALLDGETASLQSSVVSRLRAEHSVSLRVRIADMFEDMHLVYAGLGATASVAVCVLIMLGMLRFAASGQSGVVANLLRLVPGSGQHGLLLTPGEDSVEIDLAVTMPRPLNELFFTADGVSEGDAVITLVAVVTRDGRIAGLEIIDNLGQAALTPGSRQALLVETLLGAASQARFEPASIEGLPIAVNMVWVVAHTTVHGVDPMAQVGDAAIRSGEWSASLDVKVRPDLVSV